MQKGNDPEAAQGYRKEWTVIKKDKHMVNYINSDDKK